MTEQQRILGEEKAEPPRVRRTPLLRALRAGEAVCSVVAVAALILSLVASVHGSSLASCINSVIGVRNAPNIRDREAADKLAAADGNQADAFVAALVGLVSPDRDVRQHAYDILLAAERADEAAHRAYTKQRALDDAARTRHPIGRC